MTQRTNKKVVVSGSTIETYSFNEGLLFFDFVVPNVEKKKYEKVTDPELKLELRRKAMLFAKFRLHRLVDSNEWKWHKPNGESFMPVFLTLTFKDDVRKIEEANPVFSKFIKRLNYDVADGDKRARLKYIGVTEFQDKNRNGVIHYHVIFFNLPFKWKGRLEEIWGKGFIKIKRADKVKKLSSYLSKYMSKNFQDSRLDGKKRYFASVGLYQPYVIMNQFEAGDVMAKLPVSAKVMNRTYTGRMGEVDYTLYRLDPRMSREDVLFELL